ncbi:hypothetical protein BDY19DRAFT_995315 [Irpex rosettiformis]|uniref:Uncharacterized protein n=1 Tax=Irpex rosettiformis TaxID=378272 RepID=A0ACB8TZ25_9APHY|nr:hypothetical protein BDY19DRAFT_995315 [Irpex rosettiformis]
MEFPVLNEIESAAERDTLLDALYILYPHSFVNGQPIPTAENADIWAQYFPNMQNNVDNTLANQPAGQEDANGVEGGAEADVVTETIDHEETVEKTPEPEVEKDAVETTPAYEDDVQVVEEVAPAEVTETTPKKNSTTTPKKPDSRKDQNLDGDGVPPPPSPVNVKRKRSVGTFANDDTTRDVEDASDDEDPAVQHQKRVRYTDVTGSVTNESVNEEERANEEVHEADKDTHVVEGGQDTQEVSKNNAALGDEVAKGNATSDDETTKGSGAPNDEGVEGDITPADGPKAITPVASAEDGHLNQESATGDAGAVADAPPANNVSTLLVDGVIHELRHPCPHEGCTYFLDEILETKLGGHFVRHHGYTTDVEVKGKPKRRCDFQTNGITCTKETFSLKGGASDLHKSVGRHILRHHTNWKSEAYPCKFGGCQEAFDESGKRAAHLAEAHGLSKEAIKAYKNAFKPFVKALEARNKLTDHA